MKGYGKNKELSYLQYLDVSNLNGWTMLQKIPVNDFEWKKDTSQFNKDFIKTIMKKVMKDILEVDAKYLENLHDLHNDQPLLPEIIKIEKQKNLQQIYM